MPVKNSSKPIFSRVGWIESGKSLYRIFVIGHQMVRKGERARGCAGVLFGVQKREEFFILIFFLNRTQHVLKLSFALDLLKGNEKKCLD